MLCGNRLLNVLLVHGYQNVWDGVANPVPLKILLLKALKYYAPNSVITPELALYASAQVGGHPYYLYCLAVSDSRDKEFKDEKAIDRVIRYEIENGKIFGFWQTHFEDNRSLINADDDLELGKKIGSPVQIVIV